MLLLSGIFMYRFPSNLAPRWTAAGALLAAALIIPSSSLLDLFKWKTYAVCEYEKFYFDAQRRLGLSLYTLKYGNRVRDEGVRRFAWAVPSRAALHCLARQVSCLACRDIPGTESATVKNRVTLIDFGAGAGYWAFCVDRWCNARAFCGQTSDADASSACKVIAIDNSLELYLKRRSSIASSDAESWSIHTQGPERQQRLWFDVRDGDIEDLRHQVRAAVRSEGRAILLLVWPTWGSPAAAEAVKLFRSLGGHCVVYVGENRGGATAAPDFFDEVENNALWVEVDGAAVHCWYGRTDRMRVFTLRDDADAGNNDEAT
jgi:hypothetical protein